ncbi:MULTISPECIES: alpha/beta fold hydrolase [Hyphomonas]|nr:MULTISPECIES: alpha/beta hydrolase [Hyphomonas]
MSSAPHAPGDTARAPIGETWSYEEGPARLKAYRSGEGPEIVMFASAGREASDFNELAEHLTGAGYSVTLIEGPAINGTQASAEAPSLFDLADDAAIYLETCDAPVVVLGHAFGNRLARAVATRHPDQVRGVILLAAGGLNPIPEKANTALMQSFDPRLTPEAHQEAVRYGFFADGNDIPDYWLRGWHLETGRLQGAATRSVDSSLWWKAGGKPMLVITGLQDKIAPPADTIDLLEAELGDQVTAVRIDGAGHALLPEVPDQLAGAITDWLAELPE